MVEQKNKALVSMVGLLFYDFDDFCKFERFCLKEKVPVPDILAESEAGQPQTNQRLQTCRQSLFVVCSSKHQDKEKREADYYRPLRNISKGKMR